MPPQENVRKAPIGYWLKHADEVLTKHINQALSENGFTRFRWQVLNLLYEGGPLSTQSLFATMQTFIDARQLDEILDGFVQEGWGVAQGEGDATAWTLTDSGKAKRDVLFQRQGEVRRQAMRGISEQEYATVIEVLERLVKNLE